MLSMNPVTYIRKHVLRLTQSQLAEELDTTQATVSRWETAGRFPSDVQPNIRNMTSGLEWSDSWFFDAPDVAGASTPEAAE